MMRQFAFALAAFIFLFSMPVQAQKMAIADADYLMNESEAAKSIKAQLKSQRAQFQTDFQAKQQQLSQEEKSIVDKRPNLTEDEFRKQYVAFSQKMGSEQTKFQNKKENLDKAVSAALEELQKEIGLVIQEIAKEKGLSIVLSKQNVLYAAAGQQQDITQDVLKRLNQKKKTIEVKASN